MARALSTNRGPWLRHLLTICLSSVLIFFFVKFACRRDPTSVFFDPNVGYALRYSLQRRKQAAAVIAAADTGPQTKVDPATRPTFCVAMASVDRQGPRYFADAVGSVLAGLDPTERSQMHLALFLAHADPQRHPAHGTAWFANVADSVITYREDELDHVRWLELQRDRSKHKGLYDYMKLLRHCRDIGARYTVVIEDDVLALDGWFHRTLAAATIADRRPIHGDHVSPYLYIRLFYTEDYFGWNSEDWQFYTFCCLFVFGCEAVALQTLRRNFRNNRYLQLPAILLYLFGLTPLAMGLFFAAGRVTLFPLPRGVIEMPRFGCCSQGMLFPQAQLPGIIDYYEYKGYGYADALLEKYASAEEQIKLAISPSVLQHVGTTSSKDGGAGARWSHIFSFNFETNNPERLAREHLQAVEAAHRLGIN